MIEKFQKILNKVVSYFYTPPIIFQDPSLMRSLGISEEEEENDKEKEKFLELNKAKRKVFENALQSGIATLHLDPRISGVQVPEMFMGSPVLALNYSYRYDIPDLSIDDDCVVATLSFSRIPRRCIIPWESVFAIVDQSESMVYQFPLSFPEQPEKQNNQKEKVSLNVLKGSQEDYSDIQEERPKPKLTLIRGGKV